MYPTECICVGINTDSLITNNFVKILKGIRVIHFTLSFSVATAKPRRAWKKYFVNKKGIISTYVEGFVINRPFQPWQDSTSLIVAAVAALEQQQ